MKIIHVSFVLVKAERQAHWLESIRYFSGIIESMGRMNEVHSVHSLLSSGVLLKNGVTYHFLRPGLWQRLIPTRLSRYVRNLNPDVVIVHGLHFPLQTLILKRILGRKTRVFIQHHAERPLRFHKRLIQRLLDPFVTGYFFSSSDLGMTWVNARQINDPSRVHEVMEVSSWFHPGDRGDAKSRCGIKGSPAYLWVGRLDGNKDPETLLNAFVNFVQARPGASLYVIHQSDELIEAVRRIAAKAPRQIILVGKIPHAEMEWWYNAADFIVSTSHYESGGVSLVEAMACGCIPVLSDIPPFRTLTANGHVGLLFRVGDAGQLKEALDRSCEINLAEERIKVINRFNENFSFSAIAGRITGIITGQR